MRCPARVVICREWNGQAHRLRRLDCLPHRMRMKILLPQSVSHRSRMPRVVIAERGGVLECINRGNGMAHAVVSGLADRSIRKRDLHQSSQCVISKGSGMTAAVRSWSGDGLLSSNVLDSEVPSGYEVLVGRSLRVIVVMHGATEFGANVQRLSIRIVRLCW